jgi:putative transcriptional regulator
MGKNHKKLLNNLEDIRKSAGLTQHELSIKAEVSRKSINAIENGVYVPSTVLALKIAKTLNCKVEEMICIKTLFQFTMKYQRKCFK